MNAVERRIEKLERQKHESESEQITVTLGEDTVTFKNSDQMLQAWV